MKDAVVTKLNQFDIFQTTLSDIVELEHMYELILLWIEQYILSCDVYSIRTNLNE
jgi:hypothetical protein